MSDDTGGGMDVEGHDMGANVPGDTELLAEILEETLAEIIPGIVLTPNERAILQRDLRQAAVRLRTLTRQLQEAVEERDVLLSVTVGAIPETTEYANGWNDCRQEYGARRKAALTGSKS